MVCGVFFALLLAGCGGAAFMPDPGAFLGDFTVTAADIGDLSFTATTSGVAGTGVLHNGALDVDVAVSANVTGLDINGTISNTNLGSGNFKGRFAGAKSASGTFTLNIVTGTQLTGTWSAAAP